MQTASLVLSIASLVGNDTDPNGDGLTITAVGNASNGTVSLDLQTGNVIFTPASGYTGPASFTYTLSDGRGGTDQGAVSVNVTPQSSTPGVTLFQSNVTPTGTSYTDNAGLQLGMKFVASANGTVSAIRFYKAAGDTGIHTGSIWTTSGQLVGTVSFTGESSSGWQTATFSSPVQITAGTTYIASYYTSNGTYLASGNFFSTSYTNGVLSAPSSSTSGGNGVYAYGTSSSFPNATYSAANYWVDVVFNQANPPANSAPVAVDDGTYSVVQNTPFVIAIASLVGNDTDPDNDTLTITAVGNASNGTVSIDAQNANVIFTPTSGYTGPANFTYTVSDGRGGTDEGLVSVNVTTQPSTPGVSLFQSATPTGTSYTDNAGVQLGMKFVSSANGTVSAIRFYKAAGDTGIHTGSIWTTSGQLVGTVNFTGESASGWQTATFSSPVQITAGTTYIASYYTSNGTYVASGNFFSTSYTNGVLSAPSSSTSGGNGVYAYGTSSSFPNATYSAANYWVDVVFNQTTAPTNTTPVAVNDPNYSTTTNTALTISAANLLANDTDADQDTLTVTGVSGAVNGTVAYDSQTNAVTFTPTAGYTGAASFNYSISDGRGGTASAQVSLTVNSPVVNDQNLFGNATPSVLSDSDAVPVNLGMKFQADVAGSITGFRFYKSAENTGPHTGYLWTATGTLLASATFTNESGSGWQSVTLSDDVEINANTTYVVSYSSNGHYSSTSNFFNTGTDSGNLHALSAALSGGNGVYAYGTAGLFPTNTYGNTNYYVDVAFRPQLAA